MSYWALSRESQVMHTSFDDTTGVAPNVAEGPVVALVSEAPMAPLLVAAESPSSASRTPEPEPAADSTGGATDDVDDDDDDDNDEEEEAEEEETVRSTASKR